MLARVSFCFPNPTIFLLSYVDRKCLQLSVIHPGCLLFQRQYCCNSGLIYPSETFKQAGQGDLLDFVYQNCYQLLPSDGSCELHSKMCEIIRFYSSAEVPAEAMMLYPRVSQQKLVILCRANISF